MFLSGNFIPKIQNLALEIPYFGEIKGKIKFGAPIIYYVGYLRLSVGTLQLVS